MSQNEPNDDETFDTFTKYTHYTCSSYSDIYIKYYEIHLIEKRMEWIENIDHRFDT